MIFKLVKIAFSLSCVSFYYGDASSQSNEKKSVKLSCYSGYEDGSGSLNGTTQCLPNSGCVIFASQDAVSATVSVNYFCDATGICQSRDGLDKNVKFGKTRGDLYCCHGDRCNTRLQMPTKLTADHTCFHGTAELNGTTPYNITGILSTCKSKVCVSERQFYGELNPNFVVYNCDEDHLCENITNTCVNLTSPDRSLLIPFLTKKQTDGSIIERCCCDSPACNKPAPILPPQGLADAVPTMVPMPTDLLPTEQPSMIFIIGGVAAAGLFSILLLIVVIIIVRWFQRRQQEHFSYIYSQLTADLSEDFEDKEDDDARMLVP